MKNTLPDFVGCFVRLLTGFSLFFPVIIFKWFMTNLTSGPKTTVDN